MKEHKAISKSKIFSGYLLINLAYYSSLPYLAIYLKVLFDLNPGAIAIVVAAGPAFSCCASILFGKKIDKYSKKNVMSFCLAASVIVYGLFSFAQNVICFLLANSLIGFFRGIIDTVFKTYLASEFSNRIAVFGYRAIVINISAAIGPLLGYHAAICGRMFLFFLCAIAQMLAAFILFIVMHNNIKILPVNKNIIGSNHGDKSVFSTKNSGFIFLLMTIILSTACYSQLDSSLPIILADKVQNGIKIYFLLLTINALSSIFLQPVISFFIGRYDWVVAIQMGLGCFLLAFLIPTFSLNLIPMIIMIIIFTLGELLIFQAGYLAIDKMSPPHTKGQYYGLANLDMIGSFMGPLMGCGIYQTGGEKIMFLLLCILLVLPAYFFIVQSSMQISKITNNVVY